MKLFAKYFIENLKNKYSKIKLFLYLYIMTFWSFLWVSINTLPEEINNFGDSLLRSINALRIIIPVILSVITFIFIITNFFYLKNTKKYEFKKIFQNIYFLFLIYFILQIVGTYKNKYNLYNFDSLFLIYLGVGVISVFLIIKNFQLEKILKSLFYLSILIIITVTIYITYISFKLTGLKEFTYIYGINWAEAKFLHQEIPRITGLSRLWSIISLFIIIFFYYYSKNNFSKYLSCLLIIFLGLFIWAAQSRGTLLCYFSSIIFITLLNRKISTIRKICFLFIFIVFPVLIYQTYIYNYSYHKDETHYSSKQIYNKNYLNTFDESRVLNNKTTSGRIELWKEVLNKYDKKRFFGYGPQADRNLIGRELGRKYSNNVSNAYLYAFACGGYFAMIIFIIINIQIIISLYKAIFIKGLFLNKYNIETKFCATLLFYFLMRSFIENSYALFSIDFLLVIISMSIVKEFVNKKI
jgi:hypothetical protein